MVNLTVCDWSYDYLCIVYYGSFHVKCYFSLSKRKVSSEINKRHLTKFSKTVSPLFRNNPKLVLGETLLINEMLTLTVKNPIYITKDKNYIKPITKSIKLLILICHKVNFVLKKIHIYIYILDRGGIWKRKTRTYWTKSCYTGKTWFG